MASCVAFLPVTTIGLGSKADGLLAGWSDLTGVACPAAAAESRMEMAISGAVIHTSQTLRH
jgi:hypothetical protein